MGKGVGECTAAHIPGFGWIVVDSFLHSARPIALTYLAQLGVSAEEVKLVLLTHWHDDHVRGAGDLLLECPNAALALPIVFKSDEFRAFLTAGSPAGGHNFTSGVSELIKCLKTCADRGRPPIFCVANRVIGRGEGGSELECLSPSDADIQNFLEEIGKIPVEKVGRVPAPNRNDTSIALLIDVAGVVVLLGGDLEIGKPGSGWQAVCDGGWTRDGKAALVKVPHHGSPNAYHEKMWSDFVHAPAPAVIAPYARGPRKLPQIVDIDRIRAHNETVYIAADHTLKKVKHPDRTVAKMMNQSNVEVFVRADKIGVVRLRWQIEDGSWKTELDGTARAA